MSKLESLIAGQGWWHPIECTNVHNESGNCIDNSGMVVGWRELAPLSPDFLWAQLASTTEAIACRDADLRERIEALEGACHDGEGLGCETFPCVENVSRAEVLALLAPTPDSTGARES